MHKSSGTPRFRFASKDDLDLLVDMRFRQQVEYWNGAYPDSVEQFKQATLAHISRELNDTLFFALMEDETGVLAVCGLEILRGMPTIDSCKSADVKTGWIVSSYTVPEARNKGYLGMIIDALIQQAPRFGLSALYLTTSKEAVMHVAQKRGFVHTGDKYTLYLDHDGDSKREGTLGVELASNNTVA